MGSKAADVLILGAGAAGLMCALTAGQRGKKVIVLDHAEAPGKKILISGGGRCNFTNLQTAPQNYVSSNPHFCKSALAQFSQHDFIAMVARHKIPYHEKTLGQLFCDESARDIVAMLLAECQAGAVDLRLSHQITQVEKADRFQVTTDHGLFTAPHLVLATGGLSIPKMGATNLSHRVARSFGLRIVAPRPGLVPLTFGPQDLAWMCALSGVSLPVKICCQGRPKISFEEALLFTHRGLSGPAILQISNYWQVGESLEIDLLPGLSNPIEGLLKAKQQSPKASLVKSLGSWFPARLAQALVAHFLPPEAGERSCGEQSDKTLRRLADSLKAWQICPTGSEGYKKAEVTLGGVDVKDLSSKTLEAKQVPGLFVIGEAVDVTGWLGGYNFQWAWSSGFVAGGV